MPSYYPCSIYALDCFPINPSICLAQFFGPLVGEKRRIEGPNSPFTVNYVEKECTILQTHNVGQWSIGSKECLFAVSEPEPGAITALVLR